MHFFGDIRLYSGDTPVMLARKDCHGAEISATSIRPQAGRGGGHVRHSPGHCAPLGGQPMRHRVGSGIGAWHPRAARRPERSAPLPHAGCYACAPVVDTPERIRVHGRVRQKFEDVMRVDEVRWESAPAGIVCAVWLGGCSRGSWVR